MIKTLKINFALRNTYKVNSILYSLRQIPGIRNFISPEIYGCSGGLKIFANVCAVIWEVLSAFLGKFLYFLFVWLLAGKLASDIPVNVLFLHILFFLTIAGAAGNQGIFDTSKEKYYAIFLLRMDAKTFTMASWGYFLMKLGIGFLVFGTLFGRMAGVPVWMCMIIPLYAAGAKTIYAAWGIRKYEKRGSVPNEPIGNWWLGIMLLCLAAAIVPPFFGIGIPIKICAGLMVMVGVAWIFGFFVLVRFHEYRAAWQMLFHNFDVQLTDAKQAGVKQSRKMIEVDTSLHSNRKGLEFLNELFIKRHRKLLWRSSKIITAGCLLCIGLAVLGCRISTEIAELVNGAMLTSLPMMVFLMYFLNRGMGFTQALFMNCDHSLLTYPVFKKPETILHLFRIRLREIMKINLLPATVLGGGMAILLYLSGGTNDFRNYLVLLISLPMISIFFSVHYLMLYYLLQPYTEGTEMKGGTYKFMTWLTYFLCYMMMQIKLSTIMFGIMTIVFCVGYSIVACVLVYKLGPKTFRIRK